MCYYKGRKIELRRVNIVKEIELCVNKSYTRVRQFYYYL